MEMIGGAQGCHIDLAILAGSSWATEGRRSRIRAAHPREGHLLFSLPGAAGRLEIPLSFSFCASIGGVYEVLWVRHIPTSLGLDTRVKNKYFMRPSYRSIRY